MESKVYVGTILLEKNRWSSKVPTYHVSDWVQRFEQNGFDGMELWENHVLLWPKEEAERIKRSGFPVAVFNTYAPFDDGEDAASYRLKVAEAIRYFGADAVKYNLGEEPALLETYLKNLLCWSEQLPQACKLLCECHDGTVLESLEVQKEVFARLDPSRFGLIVHGLLDEALGQKLDVWGDRIRHVYLQLRDEDNKFVRMDRALDRVNAAFDQMRAKIPDCSFTVEFTEGCALPAEEMETVYYNAVADKNVVKRLY